jgi:hypothetical protein
LGAVLVLVVSHLRFPPRRPPSTPDEAAAGPAQPSAQTPEHDAGHLWISLALLAVVVLAVVGFALWRRHRRPLDDSALGAPLGAGPLQAAAVALHGGGDPRSRVIDAYDAMERALAAAGKARAPQDSPREWLTAVAAGHPDVAGAATGLTTLFEVARFSHEPVSEAAAHAAAGMVEQLRRHLEPSVPVDAAGPPTPPLAPPVAGR